MARFLIHPLDNVEVLLEKEGTVEFGHKTARRDIEKGEKIIKYGYPIGVAVTSIRKGAHVHTHNMKTLLDKKPVYTYNPALHTPTPLPAPEVMAYRRENGEVGIRNEFWIIPTVGCVNGTAKAVEKRLNQLYPDLTIRVLSHPYGCSQLGEDHENTKKVLASLATHPNAGGVLVLSLGCENNTIAQFEKAMGNYNHKRTVLLVCQKYEDEVEEAVNRSKPVIELLQKDKRESVPLSSLVFGFKCGGSDGLSGITANPLTGRFCDYITAISGSAVLTEVPEMFGAEQILMNRAKDEETYRKTVSLIENFKTYFLSHNQPVYENPSPGNREGGITTLEDKSLGCIQKGGRATVTDVIGYSEQVKTKGLTLLEGPGNDIVSTTALAAAHCHMILFTTGRGTPLGSVIPTMKIATNRQLAEKKKRWIDFDASVVLDKGFTAGCEKLTETVMQIVEGKRCRHEIADDCQIAIFKQGVTL